MGCFKFCFRLKNSAGFSLVGTIVAIGLVAILVHVIMGIISSMQLSVAQVEGKYDVLDLRRQITQLLQDNKSCVNSLASLRIQSTSIDYTIPQLSLFDNNGGILQRIATTSQSLNWTKKFSISNITLSDLKQISPTQLYGTIIIGIQSSSFPFRPLVFENIHLVVTDNTEPPAGRIKSCNLGPSMTQELRSILTTIKAYEVSTCLWDLKHTSNQITSSCPAGMSLFTCSGSPGDEDEIDEGWWVESDYANNSCTLHFGNVICGDTNRNLNLQRQRVTAHCYPTN